MKITIDTKEDSKEEIKKAIKLLQSLVDQTHEAEYPSGDNIFGGVLDTPVETPDKEQKPDFSIKDLQTY